MTRWSDRICVIELRLVDDGDDGDRVEAVAIGVKLRVTKCRGLAGLLITVDSSEVLIEPIICCWVRGGSGAYLKKPTMVQE